LLLFVFLPGICLASVLFSFFFSCIIFLYFDMFSLSFFHLFIFSYLHIFKINRLYTVDWFRMMFHRTAWCIKWTSDLLMWMSM
jgi:hypothetical protein